MTKINTTFFIYNDLEILSMIKINNRNLKKIIRLSY